MSEVKLRPQLGMFDAISTGMAAILGAGIFAVIAPAAGIAGPALLISLVIAAFVAFCNALSSTQLAAVFPRSGGTYEFGRHMLGSWAGYLAGWMFLAANTVGPGVSALVFGGYLHAVWSVIPARTAAVSAALVMTILNAGGIKRSVRVTDMVSPAEHFMVTYSVTLKRLASRLPAYTSFGTQQPSYVGTRGKQ